MQIYLFIYGLLFVAVFVDHYKISTNTKRIMVLFFSIIFILFKGLRWETGTDWDQYYRNFLEINSSNIFDYYYNSVTRLEWGYSFLNYFVKFIGGDYTLFLIVTNAIIISIFYKISFKYSKSPILIFAMFLAVSTIFPVRQNIAVTIILWSYVYIIDRKLLKFLITVLFAMSFHMSSVLFLPFYFLLNREFSALYLILTYITFVLIGIFVDLSNYIMYLAEILLSFMGVDSSFVRKLVIYTSISGEINKSAFSLILGILYKFMFLGFFLFARTRIKDNGVYNTFLNGYVISLCISYLFMFQMQELSRFTGYFYIGYSLLLINGINAFSYKTKYIIFPLLIVFFIFNLLNNTLWHPYADEIIKYKSIINF